MDYDPALKKNNELYQELVESMTNNNFAARSSCLTTPASLLISIYMSTSLKTLKRHLPVIKKSFIYPYNNHGRIEEKNNKIKVFNRVAYGH